MNAPTAKTSDKQQQELSFKMTKQAFSMLKNSEFNEHQKKNNCSDSIGEFSESSVLTLQ